MKIFLVGVACVGKTAIGKRLATRLGCSFYDLDEEVEKFYSAPIERLQGRFGTMEDFRKKAALVITCLASRKGAEDFVIALPPRGLMGPYLQAVRRLDCLTVALDDKPESILARIVFYDVDSKPIEKLLTPEEKRHYLRDIKADRTYFGRSYRKADLTVDLSDTRSVEEASARVEESLRVKLGEIRLSLSPASIV